MTEQQRKIELQSPDDLQYLVANVKRAARDMIDRDLPPIEGEDAMRRVVEGIVGEYIRKTFLTASPNISINGMSPPRKMLEQIQSTEPDQDVVEEKEEHEPFDGLLWERAKALAVREEELVEQIAALRRSVPGVVVKREEGWRGGVEEDERLIEGWRERLREVDGHEHDDDDGDAGGGDKGIDLGLGKNERQAFVEQDWERGIARLEGLKRGLPEVGARRERAGRAEEYVRGSGRKG